MIRKQLHESVFETAAIELEQIMTEMLERDPAIAGVMIFNNEGMMLASLAREDVETTVIAELMPGLFGNYPKEFTMIWGQLTQMLLLTPQGYLVICNWGGGLLGILKDNPKHSRTGFKNLDGRSLELN
jgi:predicted regulator of Ras-like GTPase activity (Roadblock/LC7/MglB family)